MVDVTRKEILPDGEVRVYVESVPQAEIDAKAARKASRDARLATNAAALADIPDSVSSVSEIRERVNEVLALLRGGAP